MGDNLAKLQLWGGIECTVNRVRDCYFDQLEYSGHSQRVTDLERIAELGISTLRYPLLWERLESRGSLCFAWPDERLARLRELNIAPIAGLVHHGSGPLHTSLVSDCFPQKLADYARQVAARYPWLRSFTPVNEPLTTARFSGLYGHWHPHGKDDRTFVRALLIQCKAISLAMAAVRSVNPAALLVQTEDMGVTRSTEALRYQADFENERRWLSLDLLTGAVSSRHPMYGYLVRAGATEAELAAFEEQPCVPDVIGLNYYVTSERFLDDRLALYDSGIIGGNRRHAYVDVEAVRVCADGLIGPSALLVEAHRRYHRPVAITEAHIGSTPAQQAAWLSYVWRSAQVARGLGAEVVAVTAWALLGAFGWDQLVTKEAGTYEPGVFGLVAGKLAATSLGPFVRSLARDQPADTEPGWWSQASRLRYEPYHGRAGARPRVKARDLAAL